MFSLAFITSSFRVTEGNLLFENVQSGPSFFPLNIFTALKGTHFYISFVFLISVFSYFGFEDRILVIIVSVPG